MLDFILSDVLLCHAEAATQNTFGQKSFPTYFEVSQRSRFIQSIYLDSQSTVYRICARA